jgi:hypothetical protein
MIKHSSNDNDAGRARRIPDPDHDPLAQPAILLIESLIHGLVTRSIISVADALQITDLASKALSAAVHDGSDSPATMEQSLATLGAIRESFALDLYKRDGSDRRRTRR